MKGHFTVGRRCDISKGANEERWVVKSLMTLITVLAVAIVTTPAHSQESSTSPVEQELDQAKTPREVSVLLEKYPENKDIIIPRLEKLIVLRIKKDTTNVFRIPGVIKPDTDYRATWFVEATLVVDKVSSVNIAGTRFLISPRALKNVSLKLILDKGDNTKLVGSLTLLASPKPRVLLEYKGDSYPPFVTGSSGGVELFVGNVDTKDTKKNLTHGKIPFGEESIHRFSGEINLGDYTFSGEADDSNRLTFVVLGNDYYYVRGKGTVMTKNGSINKLGY